MRGQFPLRLVEDIYRLGENEEDEEYEKFRGKQFAWEQ